MTIKILDPTTKNMREVEISSAMEQHRAIPINHFDTILNQINSGMYMRWFEGKKDLTVIDFGANVGLTALHFSYACKRILCVEPTPTHFSLLTDLAKNAYNMQMALGEKSDEVIFMTGHSTENKITSADGYGNGKITVQAKPLSFFIDEAGGQVDFCKVDTESGEMKALTVGQLKYAYGKVKTFFVEVHPGFGGGLDENREELKVRFMMAGYRVEQIDYQTIVATC